MAPQEFALAQPADYEAALRERGKVVADFATRRAQIREQVIAVGKSLGGNAIVDDALLDEVTALVEWPNSLAGGFEARFLELPREVLISTLQHHQRYFPVEGAGGKLLAHFITVSNIESREPAKVRAGNERVVRPRLSDAGVLLEPGSQAAAGCAARGAGRGDLPGEAGFGRRQGAACRGAGR
jgi:glycyl-tRNA synthetase beta chain